MGVTVMIRILTEKEQSDRIMKQCIVCREWMPLEDGYFHRDERNEDGFCLCCCFCMGEITARWAEVEKDFKRASLKRCTNCGKIYPATVEFFCYEKRNKKRLTSWCRECQRLAATIRYEKRKQEGNE